MSTHYTSSKVPLVRLIQWRHVIFKILIPLFLIIATVSAFIDNVPYAYYVMGATWLYILLLVARTGGVLRMFQAHAAMGALLFLVNWVASTFMGIAVTSLSTLPIATIEFGLMAAVVQLYFRIDRIEAPSKNDYAADFPGIYRITCTTNGKQYIGQTSQSINARWSDHRMMLHSQRHHNRWLQADWNVYRPEQFRWEVLEVVTDPVWLLDRERAWQDTEYDANKRYNPPNIAPRIAKVSRRPPMKRKAR